MEEKLYSSLADSLNNAVSTNSRRLLEILEFRRIFEPEVAALAAVNAGERDLERLKAIFADQEKSFAAGTEIASFDVHFHLTLARAAKNSVLREIAALLYDMLAESRSVASQTPERMRVSLEGHRQILAAMEANDPVLSREAMLRHLCTVEGTLPGAP